jgi:hypothetical protein
VIHDGSPSTARRSRRRPSKATYSASYHPAPRPSTTRPPLTASRVTAISASTPGYGGYRRMIFQGPRAVMLTPVYRPFSRKLLPRVRRTALTGMS